MKETLRVSASQLGTSFTLDPELSLPIRPRFIPEVVAVPFGANGLIFDGVRDLQVIAGRSVRDLLPRLLPLLDGAKTIDELHTALPHLPVSALVDAIALLYSRGLIEDGAEPHETGALASYVGRYSDVTRVNSSRATALDRLAKMCIGVAGSGADLLTESLRDQAFKEMVRLETPADLIGRRLDLLVFADSGDTADVRKWFETAYGAGIRTLHMAVSAREAQIGPFIIPGVSGCYDCFRQIVPPCPQGEVADPSRAAFWAACVALHAFNIASRIGTSKLYNACTVHRETEVGPIFERHTLARLPGCSTCGLGDTKLPGDAPEVQAWIRHFAPHNMMCKELRSPRDHQMHYSAKNLKLTGEQPQPRFGVPRIALPDMAGSPLLPRWSKAPDPTDRCDLPTLAAILQGAAGYQNTELGRRRLAPSGGGLGSTDLFLIVRRMKGLAAGAYRYFGWGHELESIGPVPDTVLSNTLGITTEKLPPLLIVGVCDLRRIRQKYEDFAFRIGHLDNGVARQFIQDIGDAAGLEISEFPNVRDATLAHLLKLPMSGNRTMLSFVAGLGTQRVRDEPPEALGHHYQITDWLIDQCGHLGGNALDRSAEHPVIPEVGPHQAIPLAEALRQRRSTREFSQKPVQASVVSALAVLALDAAALRSATSGLDLKMEVLMALRLGTDDREPGLYRWDDRLKEFTCHRKGLSREDVESTMQQTGYADAAFTFFIAADFEAALLSAGVRGYREIVSRSGSMLARVQLAALSWNVVGSMWGGVAEENVGKLFDIDRYRTCPLFAASFGHAV